MPEPTLYELAYGLLELRDRVVALEAAGSVAGISGYASTGVTIHELARTLENVGCASGYADLLWNDSRIGPLLRGEGAPAPKRVVLSRRPPEVSTPLYWNSFASTHGVAWQEGHAAGWAALYAEVERQQQGGQADG